MSTLFNKGLPFIWCVVFVLFFTNTNARETVLDKYIHQAFTNNDGLRQQRIQLDKSLYALKEARSLFLPNVSLLGTYTKADGGRSIDLPLGDLFNPVYSSLNQLTQSHAFPQLKNESILFNPDNYYDARFHTTMPLVNMEVYYNQKIKRQLITQQQATVNVYKRELAKDIKSAYYHYYQSQQAVGIYNNSLALVNENIRVNESLLRNGVRNNTALTRAQTEKEKILASITEAENNRKNAQAYFNFLLNRPFADSIVIDTTVFTKPEAAIGDDLNVAHREELLQLKTAGDIYDLNKSLQRSYLIPKLNTFLDLGSQGFGEYNNKTQYYMWGINLQWDLFAGGQHHYQVKQAELDMRSNEAQYSEVEKNLQLQLDQVRNNYNTAVANYHSAQMQLQLAGKYYTDQMKVYKEGQLLYLELLDALNQLTNAEIQQSVTLANVQITGAEMERAQATYPIDNN